MGWGSVPCWGTAEAKTERDEDVWTFRRMEERPGWKARLERVPGIEAELFGFVLKVPIYSFQAME